MQVVHASARSGALYARLLFLALAVQAAPTRADDAPETAELPAEVVDAGGEAKPAPVGDVVVASNDGAPAAVAPVVAPAVVHVKPAIPAAHGLAAGAGIVFFANPTAGIAFTNLTYKNTYANSDNPMVGNPSWSAGVQVAGNPMLVMGKAFVEWAPLRLFQLNASYEGLGWTTLLGDKVHHGLGLELQTNEGKFADALKADGKYVPSYGHRLALAPTLQAKLGPVMARNRLEGALLYVHGDKSFFWDPMRDTLVRKGDLSYQVANDTSILYQIWQGEGDAQFLLGIANQVNWTVDTGIARDRLGAKMVWTFADNWGFLAQPTWVVTPGMILADRNRALQPYIETVLTTNITIF